MDSTVHYLTSWIVVFPEEILSAGNSYKYITPQWNKEQTLNHTQYPLPKEHYFPSNCNTLST